MATVEHESDEVTWKGVHISQLQTSLNHYQYPRLIRDEKHTILVKVPVIQGQIPECFPPILNEKDYWDQNHVKLPCSEKNITKEQINRWRLMQRALSSSILSSHQLEAAILSYNKRYANEWNFTALHSFFEEILTESETNTFFTSLLPKIVRLALCLPELITSGVPLLKRGRTHSISLSQLQISCLLSNAFLCAFPHRNTTKKNSQYVDYPDINFNRLFQCKDLRRTERIHEKLKCIFNYFRRVTTVVPSGIVTYSRQFVPNNLLPQWSKSNKKLSRLYVSSSGTIEDDGFGLFQVDFANKYVGGGVLATGYVQEEIRFVICPELIISRLFTECLGENEALVVTGCERFNKYKGYGHTFEWNGDFVDGTPSDEDGRKYCTVIAVDALNYERNPAEQYSLQNWLRDINKGSHFTILCLFAGLRRLFVGQQSKREELCAVATGNWGCGVYKGNAQLKSLLQVMAVAEIGRDLAYFTFGDEQLRDTIASMHQFLVQNEVTIGKIYHLLELYSHERMYTTTELFDYLKDKISNNSESSAVSKQDSQEFGTFSSKMINTFCSATTTGTSIKPPFCYRMKTDDSADSRRKSLQKCVADDEYEKSNDLRSAEVRAISNFYTLPDKGETSRSSSDKQNSKSCNFFVERSAADSCSFDILEKFKMSMQNKKKKVDIQPADNLSSLVTSSEDNDVCNSDSENVASNNISNATNEYSVFTDSNVLDGTQLGVSSSKRQQQCESVCNGNSPLEINIEDTFQCNKTEAITGDIKTNNSIEKVDDYLLNSNDEDSNYFSVAHNQPLNDEQHGITNFDANGNTCMVVDEIVNGLHKNKTVGKQNNNGVYDEQRCNSKENFPKTASNVITDEMDCVNTVYPRFIMEKLSSDLVTSVSRTDAVAKSGKHPMVSNSSSSKQRKISDYFSPRNNESFF